MNWPSHRIFAALLLALAILLGVPQSIFAQPAIGGVALRAFGAREWREAVATVGALPTCDTGSGIGSESGVLRYVVAEEALYRCSGGAWAVALAAGGGSGDVTGVGTCPSGNCFSSVTARHAFLGPIGGGAAAFRALVEADISDLAHTVDTDTTCLDAGVDCTFAGSATEGGPAASALDLACTGCVAASEVAADVATQAELDAVAGAESDDQDVTEVPYTPTTGADWTDPDPTEAGGALDALAGRLTTEEGKPDDDVPESGDFGAAADLDADGSVAADSVALGTDTTGDYVASITSGAGITGGDGGSEGAALTIAATLGTEIEVSELADGTAGQLITWDAAGAPATVATGGAGEVLTSNGAGAAPTFQAAGGGSPGGSNRQVQFNDAGSFGGSTAVSIDTNSVLALAWPGSGWPFGEAMKITTTGQTLSFFQSGSGGRAQVYSTNRMSLQGGNGLASIELADGGANTIKMMDRVVDSPSTAVCANSGDVSLGTLFISPTTSYVEITNSDADGCTLTMAEPGTGGQRLTLALAATAGGVVTLSDTPGVVNLSADWTPGAGDTLEATYSQTRSEWLETSRSDN